MQVLVNDFLSDPISLQRGVRQGDALSLLLYVLCVEVLACKIHATCDMKGFLLPGAGRLQFKVSQYVDDTTVFVKDESSLFALFKLISIFESSSGAKLNRSKTEALWLSAWRDRQDEPLGLTWVKKTKILGMYFGTSNVERDNWETRISKLDKCLFGWKTRALSLIGKVLILNILGLSKLFFAASVLTPPRWVFDRVNQIVWPYLWGSRIEMIARRSLVCSVADGGLGLRDFRTHSQALCLAHLVYAISDTESKGFFLVKYFCGTQLASMPSCWASLRDNATPSALSPSTFYRFLQGILFAFACPSFLYRDATSILGTFCFSNFFLVSSLAATILLNSKNDLASMISLRAVKVRDSLRNWGYITSSGCASCPRVETIDHCQLSRRVKLIITTMVVLNAIGIDATFVRISL